MYELFFEKFKQKVPLTVQEEEHIKLYLNLKKIEKQYLLCLFLLKLLVHSLPVAGEHRPSLIFSESTLYYL
jgi:hypothetical protein